MAMTTILITVLVLSGISIFTGISAQRRIDKGMKELKKDHH